jgi:hypothetical protein
VICHTRFHRGCNALRRMSVAPMVMPRLLAAPHVCVLEQTGEPRPSNLTSSAQSSPSQEKSALQFLRRQEEDPEQVECVPSRQW